MIEHIKKTRPPMEAEIGSEKEGIKFSIILMKKILNSQVEEIKESSPIE